MVRPERLRAGVPGLAPPEANHLSGVVRRIVYLGSARRLEVDVAAGISLCVREQTGTWSRVGEGDPVEVCWDPADSVVLAGRPSRPQPVREAVVA
jgi:ABC-type Fe3+/spermidine/putrescine transport system ATPase subunit